jgi:Glycosyl transferases group 1
MSTFIVFSDDWGEHMSSSQYLFRHIAQRHRVLWVNSIGMRNPTLSGRDVRKACRKLSGMYSNLRSNGTARSGSRGITVHQPLMLPFSGLGMVRAFNALSVCRTLGATMRREGYTDGIVVSTVPNAGDYGNVLSGRTVVYYCVDDFSQWPGLDSRLVQDMEQRLIERADVLVAASDKLYERLVQSGKPTHLLTHGVDIELFSSDTQHEHVSLAGIPHPRAGFFGLIDARTDQELVAAVARCMPDFSFVFAGPIEARVGRLARLGNVHFTGAIRRSDLPALVKGFDVLFISYSRGALGESLSPLKLKEYLASGKPIVSSPIAAARARPELISVACTVSEWELALRAALTADIGARRRMILPMLAEESWEHKAQALLRICTNNRMEHVARNTQ